MERILAVHGVTKSQTRLSNTYTHKCLLMDNRITMCGRAFCGESGSPLHPSIFFFFFRNNRTCGTLPLGREPMSPALEVQKPYQLDPQGSPQPLCPEERPQRAPRPSLASEKSWLSASGFTSSLTGPLWPAQLTHPELAVSGTTLRQQSQEARAVEGRAKVT